MMFAGGPLGSGQQWYVNIWKMEGKCNTYLQLRHHLINIVEQTLAFAIVGILFAYEKVPWYSFKDFK